MFSLLFSFVFIIMFFYQFQSLFKFLSINDVILDKKRQQRGVRRTEMFLYKII